MRLAMCNEFCQGWSITDTFKLAKEAGYEGVELAPFTLGASVDEISEEIKAEIRQASSDTGVAVVGLHWLLAKTEGMHITHPDDERRNKAADYLLKLADLCAEVGGDKMIFGSPLQRNVAEGEKFEDAWQRAIDVFNKVLPRCAEKNIILCIEPLARTETNFLINKDQAVEFIETIDHPNLQLILDCKAMSDEEKPIPQIIREAKPYLAHFHLNDDSKSYPGTGTLDFPAIMGALDEIGYSGWASLEVFDFTPPPEQIAKEGYRHITASMKNKSTATTSN